MAKESEVDYEIFQEAVDTLDLCSKSSLADLKRKHKELSRIYHPDMPEGDSKQFQKIQKAYEIVLWYMENFRYSLDEEEFKKQFPLFIDMKNWKI